MYCYNSLLFRIIHCYMRKLSQARSGLGRSALWATPDDAPPTDSVCSSGETVAEAGEHLGLRKQARGLIQNLGC